MTIVPFEHGYAAQLATEQGYEIWARNQRILYEDREAYKIVLPDTKIVTKKKDYEEASVVEEIKSYEELRRLGFVITREEKKYFYFGKQMAYQYHILVEDAVNQDFGMLPREHKIQHNKTYYALRLVGPHAGTTGYGRWVKYKKKEENDERGQTAKRVAEEKESWVPLARRKNQDMVVRIKEIPVMYHPITQDIYCIEQEVTEKVYLIAGQRGMGKSWVMNRLVGCARWKWNKSVVVINDFQGECGSWSTTWGDKSPQAVDLSYIGETSVPLPAVYLYLEGRPPLEDVPLEGRVSFKISMPFKKLILDYENILREKKGWRMDKIMPRFRNIIFDKDGNPREEFFACTSFAEIEQFVAQELEHQAIASGGSKKGVWQMVEKITSVLKDIYGQNFLDIANKLPSEWMVRKEQVKKTLPPWIAAIYCGLVPIFETSHHYTKDYFPLVTKHIIDTIFEYQRGKADPYFKDNNIQILCAIDELPTITRDGRGKPTAATETISDLAAAGRFQRIGLIAATQNYSMVPDRIIQNTDFLFCFNQKRDEEAKQIGRDFDLSKDWISKIKNLKTFECVAMTKSSHFVVYSPFGARSETMGPIEGIVLPPLNQHSAPRRMTET